MYAVGLTGGIASGKSTVREIFETFGIETFCADTISRNAVEPGSRGLDAIIERHSKNILLRNGSLDRSKLKEIIFNQPAEKDWLECLIHPIVRNELHKSAILSKSPYCILDIPLLNKKILSSYTFINKVISIEVPSNIQIERLIIRDNINTELAKKIINNQATNIERKKIADFHIMNTNMSFDELKGKVKIIHTKLLRLAN
jgi:dephospho-CoA kinase